MATGSRHFFRINHSLIRADTKKTTSKVVSSASITRETGMIEKTVSAQSSHIDEGLQEKVRLAAISLVWVVVALQVTGFLNT